MKNRKNIVVLFGGASSEYEVSLQSAYAVICSMNRRKYNPVMVGITREGQWFYFTGATDKIQDDTWCNEADCVPAMLSPDRTSRHLVVCRAGSGTTGRQHHQRTAEPYGHEGGGDDG